MISYDKNTFSEKELHYLSEAERIGSEYGNCRELSDLCGQAFSDYRKGIISSEAYDLIYLICVNYAYPTP